MASEVSLQQRITGAIVLVTLGVIFIPALLDGSGYRSRQVQDIEIKDKPKFPPLAQREVEMVPTPVQQIRERNTAQLAADAGDTSGSGTANQALRDAASSPVQTFALQVGTFENEQNAQALRDKLKEAGYLVFIHAVDVKGVASYKVRIGPNLKRDKLENSKAEIRKKYGIEGYIVNHP